MKWCFYGFCLLMFGGIYYPQNSYAKEALMEKNGLAHFQDRVRKLEEQSDGYRVFFEKHAGVYYLKKTNKKFDQLEQILKARLSSGDSINIKSHPSNLEILQVY